MKFKHLSASILAALATMSVALPAQAQLDQVGKKKAPVTALKTSVSAMPTRSALSAIVPDGWRVQIHAQALLPATMGWQQGEPWTEPLSRMADENGLPIIVDWASRTVSIEPAMPLGPTAEQVRAAALQNKPITAKSVARVPAEAAFDLIARRHGLNLFFAATGNPMVGTYTLRGVDLAEDLDALIAALPSDAALSVQLYRGSDTLLVKDGTVPDRRVRVHQGNYEGILQRSANAAMPSHQGNPHGAPVVAPGVSLSQSLALGEGEVVAPRSGSRSAAQPAPAASTGLRAPAARPAAPISRAESAPLTELDAMPLTPIRGEADKSAPVARYILEAKAGDPLSYALEALLKQFDYRLEWRADGDMRTKRDLHVEGTSLVDVLNRVLPRAGLSAEIFKGTRTVVITPRVAAAPL